MGIYFQNLYIIIVRSIHVAYSNLFFYIAVQHSIVWIDLDLFIHSPGDGHLGIFAFKTIMNKATINILVCIYNHLSREVELLDHSVDIHLVLEDTAVFQSVCNNFPSYWQ